MCFFQNSRHGSGCGLDSLDLLASLRHAPNLAILRITPASNFMWGGGSEDKRSVLLANLKTLEANGVRPSFICALDTPNLENLDVFIHKGSIDQALAGARRVTSSLTEFLQHTPKLKCLRFGYSNHYQFLDLHRPITDYRFLVSQGLQPSDFGKIHQELKENFRRRSAKYSNFLCDVVKFRRFTKSRWPECGFVEDLVGWIEENSRVMEPDGTTRGLQSALDDHTVLEIIQFLALEEIPGTRKFVLQVTQGYLV
ncbi:hypothetical protein CC2G_013639 [Coprinopsis cinerea AmutBmut pab1-1]|nr:hypothetical protein CC2G_013639 [Coprinopsis cinerea AmutBmut pab1-1]